MDKHWKTVNKLAFYFLNWSFIYIYTVFRYACSNILKPGQENAQNLMWYG